MVNAPPFVVFEDAPEQMDDLTVDAASVPLGPFGDPLAHLGRQTKTKGGWGLVHVQSPFIGYMM
jgi:hypothetical protein